MFPVVTLLSVTVVFVLPYWILKRILTLCDLDKAEVLNVFLSKPTWTKCWYFFSLPGGRSLFLAFKFDRKSFPSNVVLCFLRQDR